MDRPNRVLRHKAAIKRFKLSKPVDQALADGVLRKELTFFDYGCGLGDDIRLLAQDGYQVSGWDPVFANDRQQSEADCVNLGYVINVIEDPQERAEVLKKAFGLAHRSLIVAAQLNQEEQLARGDRFQDGILTRKGTFQKYYDQAELGTYIRTVLEREPIAATGGVYYVFRDEAEQQRLLLRRIIRGHEPRIKPRASLEADVAPHRALLEDFAKQVDNLGRLPRKEEFPALEAVEQLLGKPSRCLRVCEKLIPGFDLGRARERRRTDLQVFIALGRFSGRPPFSSLPDSLQWDIRELFGSYTKASELGDQLLFRVGRPEEVDRACRESPIGKLLPNALYVHASLESRLSPVLRTYLGCGRAFVGVVPDVDIFKIHRLSGKISYLSYPDFDRRAHPALKRSFSVNLRTRETWERDYSNAENPPVLHRKETFVDPEYPGFGKFQKLTLQEEKLGLLEDSTRIGFLAGWQEVLSAHGVTIKGHRAVGGGRKGRADSRQSVTS